MRLGFQSVLNRKACNTLHFFHKNYVLNQKHEYNAFSSSNFSLYEMFSSNFLYFFTTPKISGTPVNQIASSVQNKLMIDRPKTQLLIPNNITTSLAIQCFQLWTQKRPRFLQVFWERKAFHAGSLGFQFQKESVYKY